MLGEWFNYDFMRNAFLAVCLATPLFALLGIMVINNRMAFFADVLGHSSLTGIALGVLIGLGDPFWAMVAFAVLVACAINFFKGATHATSDTVLGVFLSVSVALGIMVLSRGGGFSKFTSYLIGDILTVTRTQIITLGLILCVSVAYLMTAGNGLMFLSVNPSVARVRRVPVAYLETTFTILLALVVAFSIRLVGILIINALLVLPAAAARIVSRNFFMYAVMAVVISLTSGIAGLILSYYWGTSAGATIVLCTALWYGVLALTNRKR
ncbi:MAG: metal ABC transporter permease [Candidatus Omnitrophica bacterium]|nr:metal ABC transporter permease [Candidatus Omnitrophota bacterium]